MCIAILNTPKQILSKETLNNCWINNGDGAGMLYIQDGKLTVFKELDSFKKYYNHYKDAKKKNKKSWFVLHFRISTHGKVNETNCHPFLVNDSLGFVHNGMIYGLERSTELSDTYLFNQTILKGLPQGFEHNEAIKNLLDSFIDGSKLIFLNDKNEWSIVNESAGHWADGNWFSNRTYEKVNEYIDYGGKKLKRGNYKFDSLSTYSPSYKKDNSCEYCMNPHAFYSVSEDAYLCTECRDYFQPTPKVDADKPDLDFYIDVQDYRLRVEVIHKYCEVYVTDESGETVLAFDGDDAEELLKMTQQEITRYIENTLLYDSYGYNNVEY